MSISIATSGSQGANFTAGGRELLASRSREAGDSVLVKTERERNVSTSFVSVSNLRAPVPLVPARVLLGKHAIIVGKPLNILTVDDEFRVAHALAFALSDPARKLTLAFSADEALAKISDHSEPFDMVIIDHKMPKVSGIELVQRLRAVQFGGKIIVLSAHLTDENRRAYAELNVDTMLTKPFDVHELRQVVDSLAHAA